MASGPVGPSSQKGSTLARRPPTVLVSHGSRRSWTLELLHREWGLDSAALAGTAESLPCTAAGNTTTCRTGVARSTGCINEYTLANGAWLGANVAGIAQWFLDHQQADGGWNCEWVNGSTRSSFHSTLNSLKGLLAYEAKTGGSDALSGGPTRRRGVSAETPSERRLSTATLLSHRGDPLRVSVSLVLTACSTPRSTVQRHLNDGVAPDPRLAEAIAVSAPPAAPTAPGCRNTVTRDERGLR